VRPHLLLDHLRGLAPQHLHLHLDLDRAQIQFDVPSPEEQRRDLLLAELRRVEQGRHQHQLVHPEARLFDPHAQLADLQMVGELIVRRLVHPVGSLRLGPPHPMVGDPQPQAAAEVDLATLMRSRQDIDAALDQRRDPEIRGEGAVPEDDVAGVEAPPE
jgi:hypothetical protein